MNHMAIDRRRFIGSGVAAGALAKAAVQPSGAGALRAGAATSNITPALGAPIVGNFTIPPATEVHDELHVRAVALENGSTRLALATVDVCVLPREPIDRAKRLIEEKTGIPPSHVLISAVHTHSGPATGRLLDAEPDPGYVDFLVVRIADAVRRAVNHLEPARAGWGVGHEDRLVFNRRYFMKPGAIAADPFGRAADTVATNPGYRNPNVVKPAGPVDPEVGVLAIESLDGRPISVLGSYALHYVGGVPTGHLSADYFAVWADAMARLAGYEQMQRVAEILAAESFRTWRTVEFTGAAELRASQEEIELAIRKPDAADVAYARKMLASAPNNGRLTSAQAYAKETLALAAGYPDTIRTVVQAFRIGSLGIATFPGEAFVELGMEVKAKSPFKPTFLIELANDYRGYIPTARGMDEGGYETWRAKSSCLEREAGPKLVAAALRRLEAVRG
jgi:neutral ceramidase